MLGGSRSYAIIRSSTCEYEWDFDETPRSVFVCGGGEGRGLEDLEKNRTVTRVGGQVGDLLAAQRLFIVEGEESRGLGLDHRTRQPCRTRTQNECVPCNVVVVLGKAGVEQRHVCTLRRPSFKRVLASRIVFVSTSTQSSMRRHWQRHNSKRVQGKFLIDFTD